MADQEPVPRQIDVSQLSVQQLKNFSQQLEQEVEFLTSSVNQLKVAQNKFTESEEAMVELGKPGSDVLVPLTASMYVPGKLEENNDLLVDIGTGYYVSMNRAKAQEFFKRKIDYVSKNIEKVQPILGEKYRSKQLIGEVLQERIQQLAANSQTDKVTAVAKS